MKTSFSELFPDMCRLASTMAYTDMPPRTTKEAWILALMAEGWSVTEYGNALLQWLGAQVKVTDKKT